MKHMFLPLLLTIAVSAWGQDPPIRKETFSINVKRARQPIKIDGLADEPVWQSAETTTPFLNKWPLDSGEAKVQTQVKMLFNEQYLYLSATSYQNKNDLVIQSLKRDGMEAFWGSDAFAVVLDPINQRANGFLFGVNAGGAQLDADINVQGSWSRANENWDNKWYSATIVYDDRWEVEMAIPFSSLRFKGKATEWGLNFIRADMKNNVFSTWARVPLQFNGIDLGSLGTLRWEESFLPDQSKVTLIPYTSGGWAKNHEEGKPTETMGGIGLDAKVAVSSSLNLDLTVLPDFSNVEVDQQMTNVTRFSLFFPERRNFFLENADLFTNFGSWQVMPFFSRKIGMHEGTPVPIVAGARLSGNVTKGMRVGLMDIQTAATDESVANNYLVASVQQRVWSRSLVKFFAANRQQTTRGEGSDQDNFNRTYGGEFQYVSANGTNSATLRMHRAETPDHLRDNGYYSAQYNRNVKKYYTGLMAERVGENYVNDFGFVPRLYNHDALRDTTIRLGHYTLNPWFGWLHYPKNSKRINLIEPNTWSVINYKDDGGFLERNTSVNLFIGLRNTGSLFVEAFQTDVALPFASDIIGEEKPLPADRYTFTHYRARYRTDTRKWLRGEVSAGMGRFYGGRRMELGGSVNVRRQPWGSFGVTFLQNRIELPPQYGSASFLLVGPRSEVSFRHNLWWTTFLQYNTQAENFNINSRLQWRFRPMSDFFLVYTDNYTDQNLVVKNRGLVCKLTYWLNL